MNTPRHYLKEFPDLAGPMPEADHLIAAGWDDQSWHNDACPSFVSPCETMRLWVEFPNEAMRDNPERFCLTAWDADADHSEHAVLLVTDNWAEVLAFIAGRAA